MKKKEKLYHRLEQKIVPGLKYNQLIYEELLDDIVLGRRWLDAGCGHGILPPWREDQEIAMISQSRAFGCDIDINNLKKHRSIEKLVIADLINLPYKNNKFDVVTCNMVIEHLANPLKVFNEYSRILRKDGYLIIHTPNLYGYTTILSRLIPDKFKAKLVSKIHLHRTEEDAYPTFYRANTKKQLSNLLINSGFKEIRTSMLLSSAQTTFLPIAIVELLLIRCLKINIFSNLRLSILAIYQKV